MKLSTIIKQLGPVPQPTQRLGGWKQFTQPRLYEGEALGKRWWSNSHFLFRGEIPRPIRRLKTAPEPEIAQAKKIKRWVTPKNSALVPVQWHGVFDHQMHPNDRTAKVLVGTSETSPETSDDKVIYLDLRYWMLAHLLFRGFQFGCNQTPTDDDTTVYVVENSIVVGAIAKMCIDDSVVLAELGLPVVTVETVQQICPICLKPVSQ